MLSICQSANAISSPKVLFCEQESVHCRVCSANTHEHQYVQLFYNVMATGIGAEEYRVPGRPLGKLLQALENEIRKSCDVEKGAAYYSFCAQFSR